MRHLILSLISTIMLWSVTSNLAYAHVLGINQNIEKDAGIDFKSTEPLFVSLGSFCGPALTIQATGLRRGAFPLDWMLSVDGEKVIKLLDDNFLYFFNTAYLSPYVNGILLHKYYHLEFSHEGTWIGNTFFDNYPGFLEKYQRRINRFRKLNYYKGKIFFVRAAWPLSTHPNYAFSDPGNIEITEDYAIRLFNALKRFFPSADVHLIIINSPNEKEDAPIPHKIIDKITMIKSRFYNFKQIAESYSSADTSVTKSE